MLIMRHEDNDLRQKAGFSIINPRAFSLWDAWKIQPAPISGSQA
ncbi:MAG: hypothetical protein ACI9LO_002578 [Planctomycetota bacterium]|jgi:hypothetical protein